MSARGRRGLGLVEVVISVTILGILIGSLALVGSSSTNAYQIGTVSADVDGKLRRTLDKVASELLPSGMGGFVPPDPTGPFGSATLEYQKSLGAPDGTIDWGPRRRLEFRYERGEVDDGVDNNGNDLVDEGMVVWTVDVGGPNEISTVICHGVRELLDGELPNGVDDNGNGLIDEPGFCFERVGNSIVVRLSIERLDKQGRRITRTIETSVRPRN